MDDATELFHIYSGSEIARREGSVGTGGSGGDGGERERGKGEAERREGGEAVENDLHKWSLSKHVVILALLPACPEPGTRSGPGGPAGGAWSPGPESKA